MSNPNSIKTDNNLNPTNPNDPWQKLSEEFSSENKTPKEPPEPSTPEPSPEETTDNAESDNLFFEINPDRFRRKMARLFAEEYLNERSEKNVDTREIDEQARLTHDKKAKKKEERKSSLKEFRGKAKNFVQNNLNRENEYAYAVRAILGEVQTDNKKLLSLRKRLESLTTSYISEAKARYIVAVQKDKENFNKEGEYEGVLTAGGELKTDEKTTEKVNGVINHVAQNKNDFLDDEGRVDSEKLSKFIEHSLKRTSSDLREECFRKCHTILTHSISFDRAKDGMNVYSAELIGGTSTERKTKVGKLIEKIGDRGMYGLPPEYLALIASTAGALCYGTPTTLVAGVGSVVTASGVESAKKLRRDHGTMIEMHSNNQTLLGEMGRLRQEIITGNGETPIPINGLNITNERGITVEKARKNENSSVTKIRNYEESIANIGSYEMANAREMTKEIYEALQQRDLKKLVKITAEAETRLRYTYDEGKAVIRFSSISNRPDEERALREAVFEAKKTLSEKDDEKIDDVYDEILEAYEKSIGKDIKQKDRALKRRQILEALKSGARAGVIAGVSFLASQELLATFSDKTMGFFERMLGKNQDADSQTILSRLAFGPRYRYVQTGTTKLPKETRTGLSEKEAQELERQGWQIQQTGNNYTAECVIIDGKPIPVDNVIYADNNTPGADRLELAMKYQHGGKYQGGGWLTMPQEGTATTSADGGKTILNLGEEIEKAQAGKGQIGIIKILPDGTGIFIPGGKIDQSTGKVLLGDGSITEQDLQSGCRYCATTVDENGVFKIFASFGEYVLKKQPGKSEKIYSAFREKIIPVITRVATKLSFSGIFVAVPKGARPGKAISIEKDPTGDEPTPPDDIDEILDKLPDPDPTPPPHIKPHAIDTLTDPDPKPKPNPNPDLEPHPNPTPGPTPIPTPPPHIKPHTIDTLTDPYPNPDPDPKPTPGPYPTPPGEVPGPDDDDPDPTPPDEIPDENNNPNPGPTPPDEIPDKNNNPNPGPIPKPKPVPPIIPDGITPSPFIPPKPTGWGPDPIPPTGGTSKPKPRPEPPIGESQKAVDKFGVRTIFVPSDLETAEMFEELDRRFIALTGERPRRKGGVLESEHYIMEFVGPISSGPYEHGNIYTDKLDQPNIMYQLRKKGE